MKKGNIVGYSEFGDPEVCVNHHRFGQIHVRLYRDFTRGFYPLPKPFTWVCGGVTACSCGRNSMTLRRLVEWPAKEGIWGGGVRTPVTTTFSDEAAALFAANPDALGRMYQSHTCKSREGEGDICLGSCNVWMSFWTEDRRMHIQVGTLPCNELCQITPFRFNRRLQRVVSANIHQYGVRPLRALVTPPPTLVEEAA